MNDAQLTALIAAIREFPEHLEAIVKPLTPAQLDAPNADGWSIRMIVHHLADSHMNAFIRVKLALTEDHPTLKPYNQDDWVKLVDSASEPIEASLYILRGIHARWSALFDSLTAEQFTRTAYHPENGDMNVVDFLNTYSSHGADHLRQIQEMLAA